MKMKIIKKKIEKNMMLVGIIVWLARSLALLVRNTFLLLKAFWFRALDSRRSSNRRTQFALELIDDCYTTVGRDPKSRKKCK